MAAYKIEIRKSAAKELQKIKGKDQDRIILRKHLPMLDILRLQQGIQWIMFLTWNCKHIANAEIIRKLNTVIYQAGYYVPLICTPLELFGGE